MGAHIADSFLYSGKEVVIYDSLIQGDRSRIEYLQSKYSREIPFIIADIRDTNTFEETLKSHRPDGIVHTAALKAVGESFDKPDEYWEVNFHATTKILDLISTHGTTVFIFSSTAAVYGSPNHSSAVAEDAVKNPISPYGASKLAAESEVNKFLSIPGRRGTSLRFFNVVGTAAPELLDNSTENLVPIVINKLKSGTPPVIYGNTYPTHDGTCIRDYIDVRDIAAAHLAAADSIKMLPLVMNVGTGNGASVREVIKMICSALGQNDIEAIEASPRNGDPAFLCAEVSLIEKSLHFTSRYSLKNSIESLFGN